MARRPLGQQGRISFAATPHNRWTSYESPDETDWLAIDFGERKEVGRVELALYDDRGGVRAPERYDVQYWTGKAWADVPGVKKTPERPAGGQFNEARFDRVKTAKVRVVFTHSGKARSGVKRPPQLMHLAARGGRFRLAEFPGQAAGGLERSLRPTLCHAQCRLEPARRLHYRSFQTIDKAH